MMNARGQINVRKDVKKITSEIKGYFKKGNKCSESKRLRQERRKYLNNKNLETNNCPERR